MNSKRCFRRVYTHVPPVGWVFSIILAFVAVCSVLRSVNLLVVVTGMMLVAIILCWRMTRQSIRGVVVSRRLPNRVHAVQPLSIQWQATNFGKQPIFDLRIVDMVARVSNEPSRRKHAGADIGRKTRATAVFQRILPNETSYSSYRAIFFQRGAYQFRDAFAITGFPLSLVESWFRMGETETLFVGPQLGILSRDFFPLLQPVADGDSLRSRARGDQEDDFAAIRQWRNGDSIRNLHWRSFAKHRQPMVKQFDRRLEPSVAMVLDLYQDQTEAIVEQRTIARDAVELCLSCAATLLSQWAEQRNDHLCLGIAGAETAVVYSRHEPDFASRCMRQLATATAGDGGQLTLTLGEVSKSIAADTTLLVLSTRPRRDADLSMEHAVGVNVRWVDCRSPEFARVFQLTDELDAEFLPATLEER